MFQFRLQAVLDRRIEARRQAEQELAERKRSLEAERGAMRELEAEAELAGQRYQAKRLERSRSGASRAVPMLSQDSALQGLRLDVQSAQSALLSQQIFVDEAVTLVREAEQVLELRRREAEVLESFRQRAQERFLREESYREELEQDEIGGIMHRSRRERR